MKMYYMENTSSLGYASNQKAIIFGEINPISNRVDGEVVFVWNFGNLVAEGDQSSLQSTQIIMEITEDNLTRVCRAIHLPVYYGGPQGYSPNYEESEKLEVKVREKWDLKS